MAVTSKGMYLYKAEQGFMTPHLVVRLDGLVEATGKIGSTFPGLHNIMLFILLSTTGIWLLITL